MLKYNKIKVLGKGGFGEAILVEDKSTKKKYVIKEVRAAGLLPLGAGFGARSRRKASIACVMMCTVTCAGSNRPAGRS